MPIKDDKICRICGLLQLNPPWGIDGRTPSFEICDCCGAEFGYNDVTLQTIYQYRQSWLSQGANWFDRTQKPEGWSLEAQLKQIPDRFAPRNS
ncbi:MAG: hypothetical protein J7641_13790 [Cyanobacteria bacterium SID2]|nr:hypothetical protein [Cyanobacteria bacterium SID2]MBP0002827.1 hypothetical protein [Cyanobacteria bacterium SBC]